MKKIIALLLVFIIMSGTLAVYADDAQARFGVLKAFGIMEGYGGGDLGLQRYVTRAEFTKMAVAASSFRNSVSSSMAVSPFPDVTYEKWYAPYVYIGVTNSLLAGYKDGTFKPENNVLYEEGVAILLRLLGYQDSEFAYSWPTGQIGMAERIGLSDRVNSYAGQPLKRDQVSHLFYNLLNAKTKQGADYVSSLEYTIMEDMVLVSSYLQTDSVKRGYVNTNKGQFEVLENFDYELVGLEGDAVVKNSKIISFIPKNFNKEVYHVYSVIGNNIILYHDGSMSDMKLSVNEKIYFDGSETTVSGILTKLEAGDSIDVFYDESGKIHHLVHGDSTLEGPFTVSGKPSFINSDTQILRKGTQVSSGEIEDGDILYYSETLNMAWVYCDKVTGVYENATPNQDNPTYVTISGKEYEIEGVTAYTALASNGNVAYGDTVTLLLGKDGRVADVKKRNEDTAVETVYMTGGGTREFQDKNKNTYTAPYISVLTADGTVYEYESVKDYINYYKNQMVQLSFEDGKAVLGEASKNAVSGQFSYSSKTIGGLKVADGVKIIDIAGGDASKTAIYKKVYPQRLDGMYISPDKIIYAERDGEGKVTALFLNDLTGDAYSYGIVTLAENNSMGMSVSGSYTYFDGASKQSLRTSGKSFSVYSGNPVQIRKNGSSVDSMTRLTSLGSVSSITDTMINAGGKNYKYLSDMAIYYYDGNEYQAVTKDKYSQLSSGKTVTAYSEKTDVSSARVRVIVIK